MDKENALKSIIEQAHVEGFESLSNEQLDKLEFQCYALSRARLELEEELEEMSERAKTNISTEK